MSNPRGINMDAIEARMKRRQYYGVADEDAQVRGTSKKQAPETVTPPATPSKGDGKATMLSNNKPREVSKQAPKELPKESSKQATSDESGSETIPKYESEMRDDLKDALWTVETFAFDNRNTLDYALEKASTVGPVKNVDNAINDLKSIIKQGLETLIEIEPLRTREGAFEYMCSGSAEKLEAMFETPASVRKEEAYELVRATIESMFAKIKEMKKQRQEVRHPPNFRKK